MKKGFLIIGFLFLSIISLKAQQLDSMLNVYAEQVPDQKIHVHFDKDLYKAGETIWFKAYLFSGFSLSYNSKNFYAELINDKGNIIQRKIYPIAESATPGNFDLPDSLPAGKLLFRAYTTWMLNFDTAFIYQKNITILDKQGIAEKNKTAEAPKNTLLQFFPEGGNLVNGLQSIIAFKANDDAGMPVFVKGNIVDSKGGTVASFSAAHDGMGSFTLSPAENETYKAVWTDAAGRQQTTALPVAKTEGYVLKLITSGTKKVFVINRSDNVPESWKKLNIIAILGQQRIYKAKATLTETKVTSGAIPVEGLPSGILQVAVFSDNWEPIIERIIMVNNDNFRFGAQVNTPEINMAFRGKNTLEVAVEDTLLTNLSLSVTDAAIGRQNFSDNIYSRILLTGDIKDYVHNPGYYFSNNADSTAAHLDLVMLTHGWRKYNWPNLVSGKKPALKYPFENYLTIEAKAFGVTTASPLRSDEEIVAFVQSKDSSRQVVQLFKSGLDKFVSPNVIFFDTATFHYQFAKDKKAERELSMAFSNNFYKGTRNVNPANRPVSLTVDTSIIARTKFLTDKFSQQGGNFNSGGLVLETVVVKTKAKTRIQELEEKYTSALFRTDNGYFFDPSTEPSLSNLDIFSFLRGRVAGLQINGQGSSTTLSWRGSAPTLFLNEMQADVDMISTVSPIDIAFIKVIRPPFIGAMGGGAGGAIAVYTKKGSDVTPVPGQGMKRSIVVGYSAVKQFYSPNYKDLSASGDVAADFRSTLYWNPIILTDGSKQKVRVEFYNNDITKAYRVVLEGVNEIGKMIRIEKVIQNTK